MTASPHDSITRTFTVAAPREVAFRVFTERMTAWWPLGSHHIGAVPAVAVVLEPRAGGRWFERGDDGSECPWGQVLAWEPPTRLVLDWQIAATWQHDPALHTTVEVRFEARDPDTTVVHFEHRGLDAYGAAAAQMHGTLGGDGGWRSLLDSFATAAAAR